MFSTQLGRIALISVDADPATEIGQAGSGGQSVYFRQVGQALARRGWQVDLFTRRTSSTQAAIVPHGSNCRTIRLTAGSEGFVHQDCLFYYLPKFVQAVQAVQQQEGNYPLIHTVGCL